MMAPCIDIVYLLEPGEPVFALIMAAPDYDLGIWPATARNGAGLITQ